MSTANKHIHSYDTPISYLLFCSSPLLMKDHHKPQKTGKGSLQQGTLYEPVNWRSLYVSPWLTKQKQQATCHQNTIRESLDDLAQCVSERKPSLHIRNSKNVRRINCHSHLHRADCDFTQPSLINKSAVSWYISQQLSLLR